MQGLLPPLLVCIKNLIHAELESLEQGRSGDTAASKTSEPAVALLVQDQNQDGFVRGIDDPVFRDAGRGVVLALRDHVALRLIGADDFHDQVGTGPESVLPTPIGGRKQEQHIGQFMGDLILALDGMTITGADDLIRALTGDKIGKSVALDVLRGTERLALSLVPQERKRAG